MAWFGPRRGKSLDGPDGKELAQAPFLPSSFLFSPSIPFSFLFESQVKFKFKIKLGGSSFTNYICAIKVLSLNTIIYIYYLYFPILSPSLIFKTLISNLGFNSTSSNYYLIIFILIILFNAQSYKTPTRCTFFYFSVIGLI
jgi:hypothetical protein